jgi:putative ABC transport system permease protein
MKLTAKLAYSQVKISRSRSAWALMGIILSTALITAVCCFAASGKKLVSDLFGEGNGDSGDTLADLLLIPAGIIIALIISMSVVVISNAFRVSAGERTAQFGILKSVGATRRQITFSVLYESIFLSAAGIPIGIIIGLSMAFAGVQVANNFLGELNSLIHMMVNEITIVIEFVIAWQALAAATFLSFAVVLFSAWLPARKAARITAIAGIRGTEEIKSRARLRKRFSPQIADIHGTGEVKSRARLFERFCPQIAGIHGTGEVKNETRRLSTGSLIQRLCGFEGTLASKNIKRYKRNFRASVVSLSVSVILFVTLSSLSEQAQRVGNMMFPEVNATVMVDYTSLRDDFVNESTGRRETVIVAPISSDRANAVTERLREYGNTDIFGVGADMETHVSIVPRELISPKMLEVYFEPKSVAGRGVLEGERGSSSPGRVAGNEVLEGERGSRSPRRIASNGVLEGEYGSSSQGRVASNGVLEGEYGLRSGRGNQPEEGQEYEVSTEILTLDGEHYAALCDKAGVAVGSNILINHFSYIDDGREVALTPFSFRGKDLRLIMADNSVIEVPIHGMLTPGDIPNELLPPNSQIVRLIIPQGESRDYHWYVKPADIDGFMDYANTVMGEAFPRDQEFGYMELGFTTRVFKIQDYMRVMNIAIGLATVFVYSFVVLLILIGLTNVISTISANVRMRSREFAVLRSVGITYGGLTRMLNLESVMCTAKSLVIGLPLGIVLTYLINMPIRAVFPIPYQFPWLAVCECALGVFAVTWATMRYAVSRLKNDNIMDAIRER